MLHLIRKTITSITSTLFTGKNLRRRNVRAGVRVELLEERTLLTTFTGRELPNTPAIINKLTHFAEFSFEGVHGGAHDIFFRTIGERPLSATLTGDFFDKNGHKVDSTHPGDGRFDRVLATGENYGTDMLRFSVPRGVNLNNLHISLDGVVPEYARGEIGVAVAALRSHSGRTVNTWYNGRTQTVYDIVDPDAVLPSVNVVLTEQRTVTLSQNLDLGSLGIVVNPPATGAIVDIYLGTSSYDINYDENLIDHLFLSQQGPGGNLHIQPSEEISLPSSTTRLYHFQFAADGAFNEYELMAEIDPFHAGSAHKQQFETFVIPEDQHGVNIPGLYGLQYKYLANFQTGGGDPMDTVQDGVFLTSHYII